MSSDFVLAVHALVYLNHRAQALPSEVLAENICTNPVRVRRVMSLLRKAGLVENPGGRAGYRFCGEPGQVNLKMVGEALGARFASTDWRSGDPCMNCRIASGMAGVADRLYDEMDRRCKAYLETVTIASLEQELFQNNPAKG